jgi:hypothetical protein
VHRIGKNLGLQGVNASAGEAGERAGASVTALPRTSNSKVDLAEIDRYLEGLGKL